MTDIQTLLREIEQLDVDELQQIEQFVRERRHRILNKPTAEQLKAEMAALDDTINVLREGLSDDELTDMIRIMNLEYVNPDDLNADWLNSENGDAV